MLRSAASKVMWLGRATVFLVGLAVILALVFGVVSKATAHTGSAGLFHLAHSNAASAISSLVGTVSNGMLQVTNNSTATTATGVGVTNKSTVSPAVRATNAGGGPALGLSVGSGKAPMTVSGGAGKVANLDADKLDGNNSTAFLPSEIYEKSVSQTVPAGSSSGGQVNCDPGDVAVSGSYGRTLPLEITSERRLDERFDAETHKINPGGWHVVAQNTNTTASGTLTVYVNCADRPPLHP